MFCKKGALRNFAEFTGKHLCQSLFFNNIADPCNFIKKENVAQVFSCEFYEISNTPFLTEHLQWLLLKPHVRSSHPEMFWRFVTFSKKKLRHECFLVNFTKFFKNTYFVEPKNGCFSI